MNSSIDYMKRPKGATLKTAKKHKSGFSKLSLLIVKAGRFPVKGKCESFMNFPSSQGGGPRPPAAYFLSCERK